MTYKTGSKNDFYRKIEERLKMMRFWLFFLIAGVMFLFGSAAFGDSPMQTAISPFVESGEFPGMVSVLTDKDGNAVYDCIGWADAENKVPMTPDTLFWIASMTKQIVCAGVLTLVEERKVNLDDPVEKYLPEFAEIKVAENHDDGTITLRKPKTRPTLRQALSHTSGLPFATPTMLRIGIDAILMRPLISTVADTPLTTDPGTAYQYSNIGIDIGAAVIEVVTGKCFPDYLNERFFQPLEMTDTTFWPTKEQLSRLAKTYRKDENGELHEIPVPQLQYPLDDRTKRFAEAGGGLFSTPKDMAHFFEMLAGNGVWHGKRILSEESIRAFSTKQTPDAVSEQYSFGMRVDGDWIGHGGALQTDSLACPIRGIARLYMVQLEGDFSEVKEAWTTEADHLQVK